MNQYYYTRIPDSLSNISLSIDESERSSEKNGENVYVQTGRYDEEYEEMSQLGCGGFGTVCKAVHKFNGNAYAIKKIPIRDGDDCVNLFKELKILSNLNSDYVVKYYSAWMESNDNHKISVSDSREVKTIERSITKSNDSGFQSIHVKSLLFIQMELCSSTLRDTMDLLNAELNQHKSTYLTSIGYYIASELFIEILESVEYLHKMDKPIIHRDLKPANILITDGSNGRFVKIADFGLSTLHEITKQTHTQGLGTLKYMAPEVLNCRKYNTKADLFSLGVIMKELFHLDISSTYQSQIEFEIKRTKHINADVIYNNMVSTAIAVRPFCEQTLNAKNLWALSLDELLTDKTLIDFEQQMLNECMNDGRSDKFYINFIKQRFSQRGKNNTAINFKDPKCRAFKLSFNQFLIKDNNYGLIDASDYMSNIFENIKRNKSAKLDLLVMEQTISKQFEDKNFGYSIKLNIASGTTFKGFSKIEINNLKAHLNLNEFHCEIRSDITLPVLTITGNYALKARVFRFIPIFGIGLLTVELRNITGEVSLTGTLIDWIMKTESLDIDVSFSSVSVFFENQPTLLNGLINVIAKPVVDLFILNNRRNMKKISQAIREAIDEKLKHLNVQNMLNLFQKFENN